MKKKSKVTFLFDEKNDWIKNFLYKSFKKKSRRYLFKIESNFKKIKNQNIVFILNYTKILPKSFLLKNNLNLVVHTSALPKGKGFAPLQWQILENKTKIPICLLEADEKFDSGAIIERGHFFLNGTELNTQLRNIQAVEIIKIINKFLKKYPNFKRLKQIGKSTYYRRRYSKDSKLDINISLRKNFNLLRIVDNEKYPAYFEYKGKKYIIKIY